MLASLGADRAFVRGQGARLYDGAGRAYLDCWAQYGVLALGHNPPAVVAAVRDALAAGTPAFLQPYRAPHAEALAEELVRRAPAGIARCLFTNSGAETVEAAIKLARATTGRTLVLSAEGAYHGSTYGAMAASGQPEYRDGFGPLPAGFATVPYGDADALDAWLARDGAQTAAFIVEPIQGRRGAQAPPAGYLARARAACSRHGVALVADEIQTGLGRTGTLFACEQEGIAPDILLVAKALGGGLFPIGACLASEALWNDDFGLRHLSTFANNNLACLAGLVTLRELDTLLPSLPGKAARLRAALLDVAARHPHTVRAVRAHGLLAAIELHPPPAGASPALLDLQRRGLYVSAVAAAIAEHEAVLVLPAVGDANVLRVIPPLIIEQPEIDRAAAAIGAALTRLERGAPA
jgi:acetylornithine/succinyldiaminopimelate/putrescine aminotransferase